MTEQTEIAQERIMSIVQRVERLEEEKKGIADDIKDIYAEAKGVGLDPKYIRKVVKDRKQTKEKLQEEEHMTEVYRKAVGIEV